MGVTGMRNRLIRNLQIFILSAAAMPCLLYTSDAADELMRV